MNSSDIKKRWISGDLTKAAYIDAMFEKHRGLFEYISLLRHTDIESIEIKSDGILWRSRPHGLRWFTATPDKRSAPFEILNFDHYEPEYFDMMTRLIDSGMTIMDIGANIGWYSLNFVKAVSGVKVWAFEPVPQTFKQLEKNINLNTLSIQTFNFGFSDRPGFFDFFVDPDLSTSASSVNITGLADIKPIACKLETLDAFAESHDLKPDFIKCDVEGAELLVFRGGQKTISQFIPIVCTEMLRKWAARYEYHPNEIIDWFGNWGYNCYYIEGGVLVQLLQMDETTEATNFIFLHREKHKAKIQQFTKT